MNLSAPFINRPIATYLCALGLALAGILAFYMLPVAPLPQIEFPTISISASMSGSSPEVMASSVATPIERQLSRIAGITDMTSTSSLGSTKITIQFDLSRDINGAANDVQAALNAAAADLPSNMPAAPTYRKVNPADSPIMIIALTSDSFGREKMYDYASTILQQKILQIEGVGQIIIGGSSFPAVRIEINPNQLNNYGISLAELSNAINNSNVHSAVGQITSGLTVSEITINSQLLKAAEYQKMIIAYNKGRAIRLSDVAHVTDSVQDVYNAGSFNGKPTVALVIFKEPRANIIETVDQIKSNIPVLNKMVPAGISMEVAMDRTSTIKASLRDVEITLIISILLVVAVVYGFLGNFRAMIIPAVALVLSLLGTFAVIKLLGFSLNNLSLMALIISTGFVVDDAILVLENISRYIEAGMKPKEAALKGTQEIGFTIFSISLSLIVVFIPISCMGGIVGRLFHEFAITLSVSILISLLVSLTLTPMMCSRFLQKIKHQAGASKLRTFYEWSLKKILSHQNLMLGVTCGTLILSVYLFIVIPKGFFPQQDTGRIMGSLNNNQNISFQLLRKKFAQFIDIIRKDDAVKAVIGTITSGSSAGSVYITLKDKGERTLSSDQVILRLKNKVKDISGIALNMQSAQDLVIGGKSGNAQFQYAISADSISDVNKYGLIVMNKIAKLPGIIGLNSDQGDKGVESYVKIDNGKAAQLGVTMQAIDNSLYNSFGQSVASVMYTDFNQYYVIVEVDQKYSQSPEALKLVYVQSTKGDMVPLSAFAEFVVLPTLLSVNHQGLAPATTLSFNLLPDVPLGNVVEMVNKSVKELVLPVTVQGAFRGTAKSFEDSLKNEPYLIVASLLAVYIVLGMLYESLIHPVTIILTLPSAGVGAFLALLLTKTDLTVIAMIGIILLIGIVKKNAIMMIDFVLEIQKQQKISSEDAMFQAAITRFRPIMMTTMAALLGALPLVFNNGVGAELRKPLGIAIIGGLIFSQMLTLYTIPIIYLWMEKLGKLFKKREKIDAS